MNKNKLITELESGKTLNEIAKVFQCSKTTIRDYLLRYRLELPSKVADTVVPRSMECTVCGTRWYGIKCSVCSRINKYPRDTKHYFYIMEGKNCIKIGVSFEPKTREYQIQDFKLIHVFKTNIWESYRLEAWLLNKYPRYPEVKKFTGYTSCLFKEDLDDILKDIKSWLKIL